MSHDGVQKRDVGVLSFPCVTWSLLFGAGYDPLDKAALHQGFTGEPRLLPLRALRLPARVRVFAVGVGQHATIHGLLILQVQTRSTAGHHRGTLTAFYCTIGVIWNLFIYFFKK